MEIAKQNMRWISWFADYWVLTFKTSAEARRISTFSQCPSQNKLKWDWVLARLCPVRPIIFSSVELIEQCFVETILNWLCSNRFPSCRVVSPFQQQENNPPYWGKLFTTNKMEVLTAKIAAMFLLGGLSLLIGLVPLLMRLCCNFGNSPRNLTPGGKRTKGQIFISALSCFGGGVILTTSFTHMLPEVNFLLAKNIKSGNFPKTGRFYLGTLICSYLQFQNILKECPSLRFWCCADFSWFTSSRSWPTCSLSSSRNPTKSQR